MKNDLFEEKRNYFFISYYLVGKKIFSNLFNVWQTNESDLVKTSFKFYSIDKSDVWKKQRFIKLSEINLKIYIYITL